MSRRLEELPPDERLLIHSVSARLHDEFTGMVNTETIEAYIADSWDRLHPGSTVGRFLPLLTERFARERLRAVARLEGHVTNERPAVLFLCVHNVSRSQMAVGWLRHVARDRVLAWSAGSEPTRQIDTAAVAAMAEVGVDITNEFPKPWTDEIVRAVDVVVSMGCGDACPLYPGKHYEDWELADPAGLDLAAVRPIRDDIRSRVERLMSSLKLAS
jgi:arsenate reductase (thioredoxin)